MRLAPIALAVAVAPTSLAQPSSFQNGDLYFLSKNYPLSGGGSGQAVVHVDPTTWAHNAINESMAFQARGSYDPYRDRLILHIGTGVAELVAMDALGGTSGLIPPGQAGADLTAPVGDGRIYYWGDGKLGFLDALDTQNILLDQTGAAQQLLTAANMLIYDPGTNSLIAATGGTLTTYTKFMLNGAGDQVVSIASNTVDASFTVENPVGMNRGPGGLIYVQIDDNSNNTNPRMQLLDPVTLATSTYASSGGRIVGGDVAGAYSSVAGVSVVLESLVDTFQTHVQGTTGAGTTVATGVSGTGSSGERAMFIEILAKCPTDLNNDGNTDGSDLGLFLANWGNPGATDLDGDGDTDGADLGLFLAQWGPC
jgi:hypothetical protein